MRRRRVERCVARATEALGTGALDTAQEALEEAQRLEPSDETVSALLGRVAAARVEPPPRLIKPEPRPPAAVVASDPAGLLELRPVAVRSSTAAVTPTSSPVSASSVLGLPASTEPIRARRRGALAAAAMAAVAALGAAGWLWVRSSPEMLSRLSRLQPPAPQSRPLAEPAPDPTVPDATTTESPSQAIGTGGADDGAPAAAPPPEGSVAVGSSEVVAASPEGATDAGPADTTPAPAVDAREADARDPVPPAQPAPASNRSDPPALNSTTESTPLPSVAETVVAAATPPAAPAAASQKPSSVAASSGSTSAPSTTLPSSALLVETPLRAPVGAPVTPSTGVLSAPADPVARPSAPASAERPAASLSTSAAGALAQADRLVRATLGRYETAYSQLDAESAGAVWPAVDRRALARAFDGLSEQQISLGECSVRVQGQMAEADCRGTATWTPKFGGGSQSKARRWHFELRNLGTSWVITSATAH